MVIEQFIHRDSRV